ncbi:sensor histidine kinase [Saccharicrinis sp. GN24d3]|uniref:sensor histidine kinase n=1 Tax=Saccharicrinis sp. GN24d3 TaxID=3458416 RepID=UPI0040352887
MLKNKRENIAYLIIWSIVIALPVYTLQGGREFSQVRVYMEWIRLIPFLLIFVINNSILVPQLLHKKRTLYYLILVTLLVTCVTLASPLLKFLQNVVFDSFEQVQRTAPRRALARSSEYKMATNILISFLVIGFNNAIKLLIQREEEEKLREQKDKIHLQTELSFLRNQISPHFFMNTLNNIHALISFDTGQAQKSVIQLSTLMRHLLNDSQTGTSTIKEEFEFIKSYINLMRIRFYDNVKITLHLDVEQNNRTIPSLLFTSLVENAFKYGIDDTKESFVTVTANIKNDELFFEISNSKAEVQHEEETTGLGLINLEKQLALLYGDHYNLDIIETEKTYCVNLKIPLNND